ncbi:PspA-associated protein PspAB [Nonomuraea sp. NPDC003707]|uniref:PspA-associated protein PspAB n=1 Tax=Nonomuraea angiospora TaxID=46172 RepID=UPI0033C79EEE
MGWLDALLGRSKPVKPNLDALFALPSAAVTLQAATGLVPTGLGSVAFRAAEGGAFATLERDVKELLGERVEESRDSYGYTWLLVRREPDALGDLVTELHAVNSSLESAGFGPSLLCSLVSFRSEGDGRRLAVVYLYKRGTFYPFAPLAAQRRDNALELQVRGALEGELPLEKDLGRWFPVWGAPGL